MTKRRELISVLQASGLGVDGLEAGRLVRCKVDGDKGSARSGWYLFFDDADFATCIYGDWRTGSREVWTSRNSDSLSHKERELIQARIEQTRQIRIKEQMDRRRKNHSTNAKLWNEASSLEGNNPARLYLSSRGLEIPLHALRCHPDLSYWHNGQNIGGFPVMLGAVTCNAGRLITLHRTFLNQGGTKARVPTVKKLSPTAGSMAGATIKLYEPTPHIDGGLAIGVAEGIETSVAARMLFGVPTWASVSAHGLASFTPPPEVRHVYVFADHDKTGIGQEMAKRLVDRLALTGCVVRVHTPPTVGDDWADVLIKAQGGEL